MSDRFRRCATSSETVCHSTCRNCEKKAYKLVFDDVRLQIIQLIRNVWKTLNNLDYGDVYCSLLMYYIFLFSFFSVAAFNCQTFTANDFKTNSITGISL